METAEMFASVQAKLGDAVVEVNADAIDPFIVVTPQSLRGLAEWIHADPDLDLCVLHNLSGVDYGVAESIGLTYHFTSFRHGHWLIVKVNFADRAEGAQEIATVSDLYKTADWHEREAFDMYGIRFTGHPNLKRILCAEDWVGHPLRKDYEFPTEYHGVPCEARTDWNSVATPKDVMG